MRVERFLLNFFENECFNKIPLFRSISFTLQCPKITHRLFIELRLTNIAIFRKFGAESVGFQRAHQTDVRKLPKLPNEIFHLIFTFIDSKEDRANVSKTCCDFKALIEKRNDMSFIRNHIIRSLNPEIRQNSQEMILQRFNDLKNIHSERAAKFIGRLCYFLAKETSLEFQFPFFKGILQQWNTNSALKEGINPQPFLNAIYSHENCPNGLLLYLSLPLPSNQELALDYSFWKTRSFVPKEEKTMVLTESSNLPRQEVTDEICKKIRVHSQNTFQLQELVVICYQASSIHTPRLLYGLVSKINKKGTYNVKFNTLIGNENTTYILRSMHIGKIPYLPRFIQ